MTALALASHLRRIRETHDAGALIRLARQLRREPDRECATRLLALLNGRLARLTARN